MNKTDIRILRCKDVLKMLGISKSTLYDWLNPRSPRYDSTFPHRIKLGASVVGWLENELYDWLKKR